MSIFSKKKAEQEEPIKKAEPALEREKYTGTSGPIGKEEVYEAETILKKYKDGKAALENRIVENELWYKLRHWELIRKEKSKNKDPEPASAWLLNSIANKHADAMDNYPEPNILPREEGDKQDANKLSSILPVVLQENEYDQTYSDIWWYKLKTGTGVTGVFWSNAKHNGLGDIDIRKIDILNLFWQPGITNIQKSRNLFNIELIDRDLLAQQYPFIKNTFESPTIDVAKYIYDDNVDTSGKVCVVDWYYKKNIAGKDVLHYCKFCNGEVLYASENDDEYAERGFYDHGKYPFIFDTLFPEEGSPAGFGYIDVCKSPQIYIDKLDQVILKNAIIAARPRYWVRGDGSVNEAEYADPTKDFVHYHGSGNPEDNIFPITPPALNSIYEVIRQNKIEELKETSGNRDFSQGGTASGVTAASAIAALQEAGSKLSRDMIKSSYRAHVKVCYLCIDLMRQFYQEDRYFRVIGQMGEMQFVTFNGQQIATKNQGIEFGQDLGSRMPIFDIEVTSQKSSPFSTVAQNERAKELYSLRFFDPANADQALAALEMMQFEGIESVRKRISENTTLYKRMEQIVPLLISMAKELDELKGSNYTPQVAQMLGQEGSQGVPVGTSSSGEVQTNALGDAFMQSKNSSAAAARAKAANYSTPSTK